MPQKGEKSLNKGKTLKEIYGAKRAKEIRKKMSTHHLGKIPWNKNLTKEDHPSLMSLSNKYKGQPSSRKNKTLEEIFGEETAKTMRIKISESKKGHASWNKDLSGDHNLPNYDPRIQTGYQGWSKGLTRETEPKIAVPWSKGLTKEIDPRLAKIANDTGHRMRKFYSNPQERLRQSLRLKELFSTNPNEKRRLTEQLKLISKKLKLIGKRPTALEKKLISIIQRHNFDFRYVGDGSFWIDSPLMNPDFIHESDNKVIEVYGKYWHRNDDPKDRINTFAEIGWDCLVIYENEFEDENKIIKKLREWEVRK